MTALLRIKAEFSTCRAHLSVSPTDASEVESYLAQYLAVVLCADVQVAILSIVERHANTTGNVSMAGFVRAAVGRLCRSIDKSDVARLAGMFCDRAQAAFNASVDEKSSALYSNIVKERHKVAHTRTAAITFADVERGIDASELILSALATSLEECRNDQGVAK